MAMSEWLLDVDNRVMEAIKVAKQRGFCSSGDAVIVVTGWVRRKQSLNPTLNIDRFRLASGLRHHKYFTYYLRRLDKSLDFSFKLESFFFFRFYSQ